jgi:hypothetical protein
MYLNYLPVGMNYGVVVAVVVDDDGMIVVVVAAVVAAVEAVAAVAVAVAVAAELLEAAFGYWVLVEVLGFEAGIHCMTAVHGQVVEHPETSLCHSHALVQ